MLKNILFTVLFSLTLFAQTGLIKSKYSNGNLREALSLSGGIYDGTSYWYYPNGNLKESKTYSNGKMNGWVREYYESGLLKEEYFVKDGARDGVYKSYYDNGALESIKTFERGKVIKSKTFDYDSTYIAPIEAYQAGNKQYDIQKKSQEILCDSKICPVPLGGMKTIYDNLVYPEHAKLYGLEGIVTIMATVNPSGKVTSTEVIKGIGLGCDEAAAKAIKKTKFLPGQDENGPITANVTLNISFKLENNKTLVPGSKRSENLSASKLDETEKIEQFKKGIEPTKQIEKEPAEIKEITNLDDSDIRKKSSYNPSQFFQCDHDTCAQPVGGIGDILKHLKIPERVKENNVKGKVVVLVDVDEKGRVTNTKILEGLPHGCSIAVEVAVIKTQFKPAVSEGKPVRSQVEVTVPIDY